MNRLLRQLFIMLTVLTTAVAVSARTAVDGNKPFTVVIDPGHGGKDIGCRGRLTNEKTIVLDVAKRLGKIIGDEYPAVKVVYTRSDDRFIPLNDRARIANKASADLFISIHVNSVDAKTRGRDKIHGASVYTLGLHRNDDNLAVAMRENSVIELENDFSETYQGFDPNSTESYIIFELTQNRHQKNSIEFADNVERELVGTAGRADKGVRQSGFLVLRATSMPAVLVELDFICNPEAERFLHSSAGKDKCARSLANAFAAYYERHKPEDAPTAPRVNTVAPATTSTPTASSAPSQEGKITYSVQIVASPSPLRPDDRVFAGLTDVWYYTQDNTYKYVVGNHESLKSAKKSLRKLKKTYPEAFIIKLRDGVRIE
ncbi:MAG: N-acetylmuramoyl-L-alanine amidase [Bacteroidales bacterium]|nr:N-acetylmuramoyl-L-alanine amidase [Bacteroidales bacterium]